MNGNNSRMGCNIMYDYEPYSPTISEQSLGTASCIVLIWHREQTTIQCRPPPLKLNIDCYMVLEAWHGFQPQLVEPFLKNLVLLFRHEYSVFATIMLNHEEALFTAYQIGHSSNVSPSPLRLLLPRTNRSGLTC